MLEPRGAGAGDNLAASCGAVSGSGTEPPGVMGGLAWVGPAPGPLRGARRAKRRLRIWKKHNVLQHVQKAQKCAPSRNANALFCYEIRLDGKHYAKVRIHNSFNIHLPPLDSVRSC